MLIVVAAIVCGSLYPWHFSAAPAGEWRILAASWPPEWDNFALYDASANIAVYIPLGAIGFLWWARRLPALRAAVAALLPAVALSVAMELLQVYVPGRTSSLVDVLANAVGASAGILAAIGWRKHRMRWPLESAIPVLLLACWICYHVYPFVPRISFARMTFELGLWLRPQFFSPADMWSYAAEWIAVGIAVERLCGRLRLWWLVLPLAFHFAVRPFIAARPLVLEELLGMAAAVLIWRAPLERLRAGPWLLFSAVLLREFVPLRNSIAPSDSWVPFQTLFAATRQDAMVFLSRAIFDYGAILWLSSTQGMSYTIAGAILAGALAAAGVVLASLGARPLSTTGPALALLLAVIFSGLRPRLTASVS